VIRPTQCEGHRHEVWAVATWQNLKHFETSGAQIQQTLKRTCIFFKHVCLDVFAFPSTARGEPWEIRFVVKNSSFDIRDADRATRRKNRDVSWLDLKGMKKYEKHSKTIKRNPKKTKCNRPISSLDMLRPGPRMVWSRSQAIRPGSH
jgi:hypothetical protein